MLNRFKIQMMFMYLLKLSMGVIDTLDDLRNAMVIMGLLPLIFVTPCGVQDAIDLILVKTFPFLEAYL